MWGLIVYPDGAVYAEYDGYRVNIRRVQADRQFWIRHLGQKTWVTPELVADLLVLADRVTWSDFDE